MPPWRDIWAFPALRCSHGRSSQKKRGDTMTERPSGVRPDKAAAPVSQGEAARGAGDERAAIVIVCRDTMEREAFSQELSGRYGAHYRIVGCDDPAELEHLIRELLASGTPVALVIGGVGQADPDGIEVL